jgi:hypothetical protein
VITLLASGDWELADQKNFTFQGLRIRKTETLKREILKMESIVTNSENKPFVFPVERHSRSGVILNIHLIAVAVPKAAIGCW